MIANATYNVIVNIGYIHMHRDIFSIKIFNKLLKSTAFLNI